MKATELWRMTDDNLKKHGDTSMSKIKMNMREFMEQCQKDIDRVALGFQHYSRDDDKFARSVMGMALETVYDITGQYMPLCSNRPTTCNVLIEKYDRECPDDFNLNQRYEFKNWSDAEQYCLAVLDDGREKNEFIGTYYDMDEVYWHGDMAKKIQTKMPPKFYEYILLIERRWACWLFNSVMDLYTHFLDNEWVAGLDDDLEPVLMDTGGDYECYWCEEMDTSCGQTNNSLLLPTHCRDCAKRHLNPAATKIQALLRGNNQRWICPLYLFNKLS